VGAQRRPIDEGKLIRKTQKETGRLVQIGTQQRSTFHLFTKAKAIANSMLERPYRAGYEIQMGEPVPS
jgi:hypothetical protein